jgi:hypothetical protein
MSVGDGRVAEIPYLCRENPHLVGQLFQMVHRDSLPRRSVARLSIRAAQRRIGAPRTTRLTPQDCSVVNHPPLRGGADAGVGMAATLRRFVPAGQGRRSLIATRPRVTNRCFQPVCERRATSRRCAAERRDLLEVSLTVKLWTHRSCLTAEKAGAPPMGLQTLP